MKRFFIILSGFLLFFALCSSYTPCMAAVFEDEFFSNENYNGCSYQNLVLHPHFRAVESALFIYDNQPGAVTYQIQGVSKIQIQVASLYGSFATPTPDGYRLGSSSPEIHLSDILPVWYHPESDTAFLYFPDGSYQTLSQDSQTAIPVFRPNPDFSSQNLLPQRRLGCSLLVSKDNQTYTEIPFQYLSISKSSLLDGYYLETYQAAIPRETHYIRLLLEGNKTISDETGFVFPNIRTYPYGLLRAELFGESLSGPLFPTPAPSVTETTMPPETTAKPETTEKKSSSKSSSSHSSSKSTSSKSSSKVNNKREWLPPPPRPESVSSSVSVSPAAPSKQVVYLYIQNSSSADRTQSSSSAEEETEVSSLPLSLPEETLASWKETAPLETAVPETAVEFIEPKESQPLVLWILAIALSALTVLFSVFLVVDKLIPALRKNAEPPNGMDPSQKE